MRRIMHRELQKSITHLLLLMLVCGGCVPAQTPDQLNFTPGAPLIITDQQIDFGAFRLTYPVDWRVITSAAEDSPGLILAAPEDAGLILVTLTASTSPPELNSIPADVQVTTREQLDVSGLKVTLWLVTDQTHQPEFERIFQQIISSITPDNL